MRLDRISEPCRPVGGAISTGARAEVAAFAAAVHAGRRGRAGATGRRRCRTAAEAARGAGPSRPIVERAVRRHLAARYRPDRRRAARRPRRARFGFNGWGGKYDLAGDDTIGAAPGGRAGSRAARATGFSKAARSTSTAPAWRHDRAMPAQPQPQSRHDARRRSRRGCAADLGIDRAAVARRRPAQRPYRRPCRQSRPLRRRRARSPFPSRRRGRSQCRLYADARRAPRPSASKSSPCPRPAVERDGEIIPASYMNFYIGNAAVVVPLYGAANDDGGGGGGRSPFPDRRRRLRADHILTGGGSFHCISQQVPSMSLSSTSPPCSSPLATTSTRISPPCRELVREAAAKGAKLILPPELFEGPYFCRTQDEAHFARALPGRRAPGGAGDAGARRRAERLSSRPAFSKRTGHHHYNSLAMIDDKARSMGVYRKSHIPDGPGYSEKFYFRPGNSGFKRLDDAVCNGRRRHLLGPMVSGNRARADADGRRGTASTRPRSAPSRTTPISTPAGCGAAR